MCYLTKVSSLDVELILHAPSVECVVPVYRLTASKGLKKLHDKTHRISERCSLEYGCYLLILSTADSSMRFVAIPVISISLIQLF